MFINSLILYFNKKVNLGHIYLPTLIKGFHIKMCSLTNPVVNEKGEAKATKTMYKKNKWTIWIISVLLISIALDLSAQEKQPNVVFILADDLAVVEISGKELKELLNYSLQLTYGFAQFSGLTMEYDSSLPNGFVKN